MQNTIEVKDLLVYSPKYNTDLKAYGVNKPFALDRGQVVLERLQRDCGITAAYTEPAPVSNPDIELVHSPTYLESLKYPATWLQIFEFDEEEYRPGQSTRPLSELLDDIKLKCGGTVLACRQALRFGLAANLGGGYHHAFSEQGRGFCVLNDIAIALCSLTVSRQIKKAMVVDVDFHQGDGTALIFQDDPNVFTFSIHSAEGWPETKQTGSLDIALKHDETGSYLERLKGGLETALSAFTPELVIYVAGSDPYELDVLPGTRFMNLSLDTLLRRDELVIDRFVETGIPLAMVFAGGYGPHVWEVHYNAVKHLLKRAGALAAVERV